MLYNIVLVSVIYPHESAIRYTYVSSLLNLPPSFFLFKLKYRCFTMSYQSLLYSKVTQLYTSIHSFLLNILSYYGLSRDIGFSSLCYTVGSCCLSILNIIVFIYQPPIPSPSLSLLPLGNYKSILDICESVSVF